MTRLFQTFQFFYVLLFFFQTFIVDAQTNNNSTSNDLDWWLIVPTSESQFDGPARINKVYLRKLSSDDGDIHTCYEYKVVDNNGITDFILSTNTFCYPSVIITGVPKCSTSAIYALLHAWPHAIVMEDKEHCLFRKSITITQYFDTLPQKVNPGEFIIDGCIEVISNMRLREILHNPNTFYIVMTRNYADWIWSAYNYWCDAGVEDRCDTAAGSWAETGVHHRTPELFHDIVMNSVNKNFTQDQYVSKYIRNPCDKAKTMYNSYLNYLWSRVSPELTMVIASEDFEVNVEQVWLRIVKTIGLSTTYHPTLEQFKSVRYNTQLQKTRGADVTINATLFKHGIYTISGHKPMLESTRLALDTCWKPDCEYLTKYAGFQYSACESTTNKIIPYSSMNTNDLSHLNSNSNDSIISTLYNPAELKNSVGLSGYFRRTLRNCYDSYSNSPDLLQRILRQLLSVNEIEYNQRYGGSFINDQTILRLPGNPPFRDITTESKSILLLTVSILDRNFMKDLLKYSTGYNTESKNFM